MALGMQRKMNWGRARCSLVVKVAAMEDPLYNPAGPHDSKAFLHYLSRLQDRLLRASGQIPVLIMAKRLHS